MPPPSLVRTSAPAALKTAFDSMERDRRWREAAERAGYRWSERAVTLVLRPHPSGADPRREGLATHVVPIPVWGGD